MEALSSILTTKNTIDGIWINNDKDTKSTTKIIISNNGKKVQVFDKDSSNDYAREAKILTPETNSTNMYWAIFDSSIAKSIFIFTINNDKMEVRYEQDYKSPSRETKRFIVNFTKLNLNICQPTVILTSVAKLEDTPLQKPENIPVLILDDLVVNQDIENPYETTNAELGIYPVMCSESRIFHYLPSTYHLRYSEQKRYALHKRFLNVFLDIILNKVRNTVSIRRLMSLTDATT